MTASAARSPRVGLLHRATDRYLRFFERMTGTREADALPLRIGRRRIYVLPSAFGMGLGVLVAVMLMGSLNFNNNMGLAFTFLLGALGLVAPLLTFLNLHRVEILDISGDRVFAGETSTARFLLRGVRGSGHWTLTLRYAEESAVVSLPDDRPQVGALPVSTEQRGPLRLRRVKLATVYPLGLFRAWSVFSPDKPIVVYPAPEPNPPALPQSGGHRNHAVHADGTENFVGIREYQTQDPPRLVAWKAVARTGQLHSKQFADAGPGRIDLRESDLLHLELEHRLSRLTAWVIEAHRRDVAWSLQVGDAHFPPARGDLQRDRCLEALALHERY